MVTSIHSIHLKCRVILTAAGNISQKSANGIGQELSLSCLPFWRGSWTIRLQSTIIWGWNGDTEKVSILNEAVGHSLVKLVILNLTLLGNKRLAQGRGQAGQRTDQTGQGTDQAASCNTSFKFVLGLTTNKPNCQWLSRPRSHEILM